MKAGKVGLLILILGFGGTVETAWRVREHTGFKGWGWRWESRFDGPSFSFTSEEVRTVSPGAALEVENSFGQVKVSQVPGSNVRVALTKVVFLPTEEKAREFASRLALLASGEPSRLRVATNRQKVQQAARDVGFETHLTITVPPGTPVRIVNEHGAVDVADVASADVSGSHEEIRVERVAGPVSIKGRHGDVSVATVTGALRVDLAHGNLQVRDVDGSGTLKVEHGNVSTERTAGLVVSSTHGDLVVNDVRGDLQVVASHVEVSATRVTGRADVATSHKEVKIAEVAGDVLVNVEHGAVRVQDVTGGARVRATYDDVTLTRVGGATDVDVRHGGVRAESLARDAVIRATGDDVEVVGFGGRLDVTAERAGVRAVAAGSLGSPVQLRTSHGDIELEVPAGMPFDVQAAADHGEVSATVPELALSTTERTRLTGHVGSGGPAVRLDTSHGNIRLRQATAVAQAAPPVVGAPLAPPPAAR